MKNKPIWQESETAPVFPTVRGKTNSTTVAIIGAGITGITTAFLLAEAGVDVLVFEAGEAGKGTTGRSTGNLYAPVDEMLHVIEDKYGTGRMKTLVDSRRHALQLIESIVARYELPCQLMRTSWHLIAETEEQMKPVKKEFNACLRAGLDALYSEAVDKPFPVKAILEVKGQAQLNPYAYIRSFVRHVRNMGVEILENTPVRGYEKNDDGRFQLQTDEGFYTADKIVHATHIPKGRMFIDTLLGPYREYVVAARLNSALAPGTWWAERENHHYSMRSYTDDKGDTYVLVLGEPHKVGQQEDNRENLERIETYLREHFDVGTICCYWGAQHYKSADMIPYIGETHEDGSYIATGFSTDGLVYGTLAAQIVSDFICGKENPWQELYSPKRHRPLKAAARFAKEGVNVAVQYAKDYLFPDDAQHFESVLPGDAAIVEKDGHKYAVFRDDAQKLHVASAVCPHMGCIVSWNKSERTWDCPCHGSRFSYSGKFIEGPAFGDLRKK